MTNEKQAPVVIGLICADNAEAERPYIESLEKAAELTESRLIPIIRRVRLADDADAADEKMELFDLVRALEDHAADAVVAADERLWKWIEAVKKHVSVPVLGPVELLAELGRLAESDSITALTVGEEIPAEELGGRAALHLEGSVDGAAIVEKVVTFMESKLSDVICVFGQGAAAVAALLQSAGVPAIAFPVLAAEVTMGHRPARKPRPFKVGMIGGLGPAATVDLYDKITKATPAKNDQEHIRVVVEQNPQIPDRTVCLLEGGEDPTIAMLDCARRLEADGCDAVIVPCNTAHAFVPFLERRLSIPFINMQQTTMEEILEKLGKKARIGLLATSGTVKSGIYGKRAEELGLPIFTPDEENQKRVMNAIYGPKGAKAGFTTGECYEDLKKAAEYLVENFDCNVLILGCTELPLIMSESDHFPCAGKEVVMIDPTSALARKVVRTALEENKKRGF